MSTRVASGRVQLTPLGPDHDVDGFDCCSRAFNVHLRRFALREEAVGKRRTYVACADASASGAEAAIMGYITLGPGVIEGALCGEAIHGRYRRRLIPVVVIVRLAVDVLWQGQGVGRSILSEGIQRAKQGAAILGAKAVVAPATGQDARLLLTTAGFEPLPGDRWHLCLPLW